MEKDAIERLIESLKKKGKNLDLQDDDGNTALHKIINETTSLILT